MKMRTCIETSKVGKEANHLLYLIKEEVQVGTGDLITAKTRRADIQRGKAEAGVAKERMVKALKVNINTRSTNIRK